ncbi:unnamed protein product [Durusdinium trenchii]|uniref:Uncharacterized protein n=1 Tax=Durusdinium trenchii TaxID=1381693 RepID=A0ABP0LBB3_9DINO
MAEGVEDIFGYNRGNFMFDQKLRQWREYQEQNMRVKQFMLYREDMRDLTELTISKMDSYLMIAVLELGCCLDLLVHGVLHIHSVQSEPSWNLWLYVISLAEAFVFLFLSAWLAIHASVSAHSFEVRLLTQFVRLPVPSSQQLDAGSAAGTDYENLGIEDLLRIPVLRQQADRMSGASRARNLLTEPDPSGAAVTGLVVMSQPGANQATAQKHVRVFRDLQNNWQAHDAYARACLALGTYKLTHALAYYTVGLLVLEMHAPWAGFVCVVVLPALTWLLMRLDLYFASTLRVIGALVLMLGPALALIAATLSSMSEPKWGWIFVLVAITFTMHALLIVSVAYVARAETVTERGAALPTRFRNVLYLDVFGWLQSPEQEQGSAAPAATSQRSNAREMPQMLREALYKESCRLGNQLSREFSTWEIADLDHVPSLLRQLRALQREFASVRKDFAHVHEANLSRDRISANEDISWAQPESPSASLVEEENLQIWLRVESQSERVTWFLQPLAGVIRLEEPHCEAGADPIFISDIIGVAGRVEMLRERIEVLQEDLRYLRQRSSSRLGRLAGGLLPPTSSTSTSAGAGVTRPSVEQEPNVGTASAAQETKFGGRESADLGGGAGLLMTPEATAQTFHPRRDRREESKQPPGQVPWQTFCGASTVLVTVWMVGIGWYVVNPLAMHPNIKRHSQASLPSLSDALLLLDFNTWSRVGPLQPVGLACDDHHNSMVIAERFAVHEVSIPSAGSASTLLPSHLEKCLAEHPGFHADGLTGVRMTCSGESCHAILSGAENISLVCPLGVAKGCPPFLTSDTGSLPRGCELGLLSGFDPAMAEDSQGSLFLPKRPTVTLGDQGLLGAQLALRLLDLAGDSGLAADAWALDKQGPKHLGTWRFPPTHRWTALCHAHGRIFVLGAQAGGSELWSFLMPDGRKAESGQNGVGVA